MAEGSVLCPSTSWETARLLRSLRADIFHIRIDGRASLRLMALVLFCTLFTNKTCVLTLHSGGYPTSEQGRRARRLSLRGFVFRRLDRVIVVNDELRGVFIRYGVRPKRILLIPPFSVDLQEVASALEPRFAQFLSEHEPTILSIGGLEPEYQVERQIEAMRAIRARLPRAGLIVVGSGSLQAELEQQLRAEPGGEHILLAGDVEHGQVLALLKQAALMLRTTQYDGDAVSIREALCLGTPVIATDTHLRPPGVRLLPSVQAQDIAAAVAEVLSKPMDRAVHAELLGEENLNAVMSVYRELDANCAKYPPDRHAQLMEDKIK